MDKDITARFATLLPHEHAALVAALRRDAWNQLDKAGSDAANASYYLLNHRILTRVLDVLAPGEHGAWPQADPEYPGAA